MILLIFFWLFIWTFLTAPDTVSTLLIIYIWNFHVISDLLLINLCKLHWNQLHQSGPPFSPFPIPYPHPLYVVLEEIAYSAKGRIPLQAGGLAGDNPAYELRRFGVISCFACSWLWLIDIYTLLILCWLPWVLACLLACLLVCLMFLIRK